VASSQLSIIKLISSENRSRMDLSNTLLERSVILVENNNGLRTEPCGTPYCTFFHLEKCPFE
jgi:hypothetical protein